MENPNDYSRARLAYESWCSVFSKAADFPGLSDQERAAWVRIARTLTLSSMVPTGQPPQWTFGIARRF